MNATSCKVTVLRQSTVAADIRCLTVQWPDASRPAKAGQFFMLRAWAANETPILSRPISVHKWEPETQTIEFLYQVIGEGTHKLDIKQLYYIESQGHDLFFHTSEGELLGSGSMQEFEKRLEAYSFFRCNKGYLVNLEYVDTVHGENVGVHGETGALSRARRKEFLGALNNYINGV